VNILVTGDWHIHNYPQFAKPWREGLNTRVRDALEALNVIPGLIRKYRVKAFCHLGDWNMNASNDYRLVNVTRELSMACANEVRLQGGAVINIHGNHDTVSADSAIHNNYPYLAEYHRTTGIDGVRFYCVGYNDKLPDIASLDLSAELSVFLLHKDLEGGKTAQGFVYRTDVAVGQLYFEAVKKALSGRVIFLAGHYHHPQKIGAVQVVGAPIQHNRGDMGDRRGVLLLNTETFEIWRIPIDGPMFHEVSWPALKFICPCCKNARKYVESDYVTVAVERAGVDYDAARAWTKSYGLNLNAAVIIRSLAVTAKAKNNVPDVSILNEDDLLKKYLMEKEKLGSVAAQELIQLGRELT